MTDAASNAKSSAPTFLRRKRESTQEVPVNEDPRVKEFLNSYVTTGERLREMERDLHAAELEIDKQIGRVNYLTGELQRSNIKKVKFQEGYSELKAQLKMIAVTAVSALKAQQESTVTNMQAVIDVIEQALREAEARLERAGIVEDTTPPDTTEPLEEGIRRIAETFGAGTGNSGNSA